MPIVGLPRHDLNVAEVDGRLHAQAERKAAMRSQLAHECHEVRFFLFGELDWRTVLKNSTMRAQLQNWKAIRSFRNA
jgi:hypothetical protein